MFKKKNIFFFFEIIASLFFLLKKIHAKASIVTINFNTSSSI